MSYQERALAIIDRLKLNGYVNNRERGVLRRALLEERPQGSWIVEKNTRKVICSCCRQSRRDTRTNHIFFCNHCGAKMKQEAENERI